MKTTNILTTIIMLSMSILLSACSTTPESRFYTLQALAENSQGDASNQPGITLGISPVEVSPYLERTEIVTRASSTQLQLANYDRWAEPLEDIIARTVAENIERLQPSVGTVIRPWSEANVDYILQMKIGRFDSDASGRVTLHVTWGLVDQKKRQMADLHNSKIIRVGNAGDFDAIVGNMGSALLVLSEEISAALVNKGKPE